MDKNSLGQRLKEARLNAGLTQSEVADWLGVTYQAVSNYERGKCRVESGLLRKLCILYRVDPQDLLGACEWGETQRRQYASASSAEEKRLLFEMYGIPAEMAAEYEALQAQQKTAAQAGSGLSAEEDALITLFRAIPAANRALVLDMVRAALSSQGLL